MRLRWQNADSRTHWDDGGEQRLAVSLLVATLLVFYALSLFRMPDVPEWSPVLDLAVRIVSPEVDDPPVPESPPADTAATAAEPAETVAEPPPPAGVQSVAPATPYVDWEARSGAVIEDYLDSRAETYGYVNGDLAEKRRRLAERYQPGTHEKPKPIWENVEVDTLGRTVLRSGDCFKVLDDPNVGSREAFLKYHQFIAICTYQRRMPRNLPWVEPIRERYEYLHEPEGYLKGEAEE